MVEGKCPKCGNQYHGWALLNPRGQTCPRCGVGLEITEDGHTYKGYSPFSAEKYIIKSPENTSSSQDKDKDKYPDKKQ